MMRTLIVFLAASLSLAEAARGQSPLAAHRERSDAVRNLPAELQQSTSEELWAAYVRVPYTHPQIPNVSYAGYQFSERPIPLPPIVANVREQGAKGDGRADDSPAFKAAIAQARKQGGGAILIPAGHYKLEDMLTLDTSGLVLRGEGSDKTFLEFTQPLSRTAPRSIGDWRGAAPIGSWYGGVIWVEPGGPQLAPWKVEINVQPLAGGLPVVKPAAQGDFALEVAPADAARLAGLVGKMVPIAWTGDRALALRIAGAPAMERFDWSTWRELYDGKFTWIWANQIEKIEGARIVFKKPLRLDVRLGEVAIGTTSPYLTEVGVEGFTIRFPPTQYAGHHREVGYNGVMFRRVAHGWVRDVAVENADNGIFLAGECVNCTVTGFKLSGRQTHHGLSNRFLSHDNLYERFRLESQMVHGISTEGESSGNVWRGGVMLNGTFDYHRMMSFDSLRTDITVENNGGNGGNGTQGPAVGRRICHWNIRITNGVGKWIAAPALFSNAAFVGLQGAPLDLRAKDLRRMPDGLDKGCVVADQGRAPVPGDLFAAQLRLRLPKSAAGEASGEQR
jgi:hypothetical protein